MSETTGGKIVTTRRNAHPGDMHRTLEYRGPDGQISKIMELFTVATARSGARHYASFDFPGERFSTTWEAEEFALKQAEANPCPSSQPDREHATKEKELIAKGATICPLCNGSEIIGDACDHEDGKIYQDAECGDCGATWRYEYSVTNILNVYHE